MNKTISLFNQKINIEVAMKTLKCLLRASNSFKNQVVLLEIIKIINKLLFKINNNNKFFLFWSSPRDNQKKTDNHKQTCLTTVIS